LATTRRLSAVLAVDVAGYSRLMGKNEEGTLRRLQAHRRELFDPKVHEHRGRIVKTTGDGALVEFASVVDAVRCAVEVQRGMVERNAEAPKGELIEFRMGINLGDIILEKGDIFGDGVNVAARLEALAEPGGLCISGTVRDHIGNRLPYAFLDTGEQNVKNIAQPIHVYTLQAAAAAETPLVPAKPLPRFSHWRASIIAVACLVILTGVGLAGWSFWSRPGSPTAATPRLSIVVLPFANLSNDPEQEYFVDAITDDLTTDLSRIEGSFVISRMTAFTYKGKPIDAKQLGDRLGVRYVLEGSVRRLADQVQVNVQLIDSQSGAHVWADRFDTDRTNLVKAQEDIVGRLARTLHLQLVEAVGRQVDPSKNPDAQDLVMRGWAYNNRQTTPENQQEALNAFEKALALDPESAEARAGMASVLELRVAMGRSANRDADLTRGEQLAREAIARAPSTERAYYALGAIHRLQNRLAESRTELEKAIELDRNNAAAWIQLGITHMLTGKPEAAVPHFEQALKLTPGSANIHFVYFWLGYDHLIMNDTDRAIEYLRKACTELPQFGAYHLILAAALGLKGEVAEAKTELATASKLKLDTSSLAKLLSTPNYRDSGTPQYFSLRKKTFEAGLLSAGMPAE
jgi:adenylate cyclase